MRCSSHGEGCIRQQPGGVVRCSFAQSMPEDGVLIEGDQKKSSRLVYRAPDGEIFVVPNIWYNQPIAWRIDHLKWLIERARSRARFLRATDKSLQLAKELEEQAIRLEGELAELSQLGERRSA